MRALGDGLLRKRIDDAHHHRVVNVHRGLRLVAHRFKELAQLLVIRAPVPQQELVAGVILAAG